MLAAAGLGVLYIGAYFLAPALGMAHFHPKG
jgi:hypothetical protein